jgi:hypothetical protein
MLEWKGKKITFKKRKQFGGYNSKTYRVNIEKGRLYLKGYGKKIELILVNQSSALFQYEERVYFWSIKLNFLIDFTNYINPVEYPLPSFLVRDKVEIEVKRRKAIYHFKQRKQKTYPAIFVRFSVWLKLRKKRQNFESYILLN